MVLMSSGVLCRSIERLIHMNTSKYPHLVPSKRARLAEHGQEMVTLAGTRLRMCTKPQQTAEMNASYWNMGLVIFIDIANLQNQFCQFSRES